jgi:hypothetical protein
MISFFIEIPFYIVCIDECIRPSDSRRISKTHSMRCRQVVRPIWMAEIRKSDRLRVQ